MDKFRKSVDFLYAQKYNRGMEVLGGRIMARTGRPKAEVHRERALTMRMLPEQKERLEYYADKYGMTKTQVILKALDKLYKEDEQK